MSFIEKLQNKSKGTRVLILWLTTGLVMVIIICIWLFSFSRNSGNQSGDESSLPSLFESIEKDFSIFKQGLDASVEDIKEEGAQIEQQLQQYEEE